MPTTRKRSRRDPAFPPIIEALRRWEPIERTPGNKHALLELDRMDYSEMMEQYPAIPYLPAAIRAQLEAWGWPDPYGPDKAA